MGVLERLVLAARAGREHAVGRRLAAHEQLSAEEILAKVLELDISTWSYVFEPSDVVRIGPMAQDFHESFGFGASDRTLPTESAIGVLLVCVKVLARRVGELEERAGAPAGRAVPDGGRGPARPAGPQ